MLSKAPDNEVKLKNAIYLLVSIINDTAVPRNIRRAANAVGVLDQVSQDPNMPLSARTKIWQVIAILETVHD